MKITRIDLRSESTNTIATLKRDPETEMIDTTVIDARGFSTNIKLEVNSGIAHLRSAANYLHQKLEGFEGTAGDVQPYQAALESMSDI